MRTSIMSFCTPEFTTTLLALKIPCCWYAPWNGFFIASPCPLEYSFSFVDVSDLSAYCHSPRPQTSFCQNIVHLIWILTPPPRHKSAASPCMCQWPFIFKLPWLPWFLSSPVWKDSLRPPSETMAEQGFGVQFLLVLLQLSIHLNHAGSKKATVVSGQCWLLGWQLLAALLHHQELEGRRFICKFGPPEWTIETEGTMSGADHVCLAGCFWLLQWHP